MCSHGLYKGTPHSIYLRVWVVKAGHTKPLSISSVQWLPCVKKMYDTPSLEVLLQCFYVMYFRPFFSVPFNTERTESHKLHSHLLQVPYDSLKRTEGKTQPMQLSEKKESALFLDINVRLYEVYYCNTTTNYFCTHDFLFLLCLLC